MIINFEPSLTISVSTLEITSQVSHYSGETVTRIDSNSAEGVFLTLTRQTLLKAAIDNLWYNSGWARIALRSRGYQWPGCSGLLTHLPLDPLAPFRGDFHFSTSQPELSY
jgi:hypothetical protein